MQQDQSATPKTPDPGPQIHPAMVQPFREYASHTLRKAYFNKGFHRLAQKVTPGTALAKLGFFFGDDAIETIRLSRFEGEVRGVLESTGQTLAAANGFIRQFERALQIRLSDVVVGRIADDCMKFDPQKSVHQLPRTLLNLFAVIEEYGQQMALFDRSFEIGPFVEQHLCSPTQKLIDRLRSFRADLAVTLPPPAAPVSLPAAAKPDLDITALGAVLERAGVTADRREVARLRQYLMNHDIALDAVTDLLAGKAGLAVADIFKLLKGAPAVAPQAGDHAAAPVPESSDPTSVVIEIKAPVFSPVQTGDFREWFGSLETNEARLLSAKIELVRRRGPHSPCIKPIKNMGGKLWEISLKGKGPGLRAYVTFAGEGESRKAILLCGGDKQSQISDLQKARNLRKEFDGGRLVVTAMALGENC